MNPPPDSRYWRDDAACRLEDARLFDPPEGRPSERRINRQMTLARTICRRCTVPQPCLADAIEKKASGMRAGQYLDRGRPVDDPRPAGRPSMIDRLRGAA